MAKELERRNNQVATRKPGGALDRSERRSIPNITVEGARILFRNFAGREGQYNREGDRNFSLLLDPVVAEQMAEDGWNVKYLKPREEGDEPQPYVPVAVNFDSFRPPSVHMITSRGRTPLGKDEVEILDWADIANVDLIVRPYQWLVNGKTGVKAYLKTLFVTIQEDELELKYKDVPESSLGIIEAHAASDDGEEIWDAELVEDDD